MAPPSWTHIEPSAYGTLRDDTVAQFAIAMHALDAWPGRGRVGAHDFGSTLGGQQGDLDFQVFHGPQDAIGLK